MHISPRESLAQHSTMKIGGVAAAFAHVLTEEDILEVVQKSTKLKLPLHILGEGSNTIFGDGEINRFISKIEIPGFEQESEENQDVYIRVGAGEHWDSVVARTVKEGLSGIEALSAIPGTAGATPVQNVGAYGREAADVFVEARAYDREKNKFITIHADECKFEYRKSIFNTTDKNRFIISSILLRLSKNPPIMPDYAGVKSYFEKRKITSPTLLEIREAIIEIRANKLPDPSIIPNCGSFFKNAIILNGHFNDLKKIFPDIPSFTTTSPDEIKVPAGWLIEKAGFKGASFGPIGIYEKNALVLVNKGGANAGDLLSAKEKILSKIKNEFNIELEQEPIMII